MSIAKEKDATEEKFKILWGSTGNPSFFRTLSPLVKNAAGLIMKMEIAGVNNYQNVSKSKFAYFKFF